MLYTVNGLVIRSKNHGENDRLVTVLTAQGKITAIAKGARSMRSKMLNLTQPFVYGNFELTDKNGYTWMRGGSIDQMFYELREDIEKLFLATYVCDVAHELSGENADCAEMLRLTSNTLFALVKDLRPSEQIKAVFELRAAAISGYRPDITHCRDCGTQASSDGYFDVMNGAVVCSECLQKRGRITPKNLSLKYDDVRESSVLIPLTPSSLAATRYAIVAPAEKVFSFTLTGEELAIFSKVGEGYLLNHLGHGFDSLDLYYSTKLS